jgi:hypothetical protein
MRATPKRRHKSSGWRVCTSRVSRYPFSHRVRCLVQAQGQAGHSFHVVESATSTVYPADAKRSPRSLVLAAGQGAAQATMDGVASNAVGPDEQGWLAGAIQSITGGIAVGAPMLAGVLYSSVAHSAPYWLGFAMMTAATLLLARARLANPATVPEPALVDA